jgi:RHS repeat-associated protein
MLISSKTYRPAVQWLGDTPEFFLCNLIGAPLEVIEGKRGIRWSASYASYGKTVERPPASNQNYCLRLPGQFEDRETGLFYNYQRYYDPAQGRFLTQDPIGTHGGLNLYDYPRDPINNFDPQGLSCPNPRLVRSDPQGRWEIYEHADGQLTIRADCTRGFAARPPGDVILRATTHTGSDNAVNLPEAHLGEGDRLIVMEGMHRSAAASRGAQMPQDPDHPHLGGVPGRPGWVEYEYSPQFDDDQVGVPLQDLQYPPQYPHQMPP